MISFTDVAAAAERLAPHVHTTAVLRSQALCDQAGCEVLFKCENLQRSGSFKIRGAMNAALQTPAGTALVTHSSGNHGAALALAGRELGRSVTVVVPSTTPASKRANIERYGATLVLCGPTLHEREAALAELLHDGPAYVPPYNLDAVMAGQGTIALEVQRQVPGARELWLPVGGGGMASGCTAVTRGAPSGWHWPAVCGAEPELASDAHASLQSGERQPPLPPKTIADGLRGALGDLTFAQLRDYGLPITLVTEQEIVAAQRLIMECLKLVVEPSGAVAFAGLLARQRSAARSGPVVVVLSGGNLDLQLPPT